MSFLLLLSRETNEPGKGLFHYRAAVAVTSKHYHDQTKTYIFF